MPATVRVRSLVFGVALWLGSGCGGSSSPPPAPLEAPGPEGPLFAAFDSERAWADLEALAEIGPRPPGSEGAASARGYIVAQLEALDIDVQEIETFDELAFGDESVERVELVHVVATFEGRSPGLFVLVTAYDSDHFDEFPFVGANDGASGSAILLEIARVLTQRELPFTTRVVFLEGEGRLGRGGRGIEDARWLGSRALAREMHAASELERVRLLVAFRSVCDSDLRIARDLGSHRMHREEFWKAAHRRERDEEFPRDEGFQSPAASHIAFRELGVRPVVAIVDTSFGGDEPPGIYAGTEEDTIEHCAPQSLETVGVVSLDAIGTIGERLAKIERYSRSPTADVERTRSSLGAPTGEPSSPEPGTESPAPPAS
jgi:hypothetical protein